MALQLITIAQAQKITKASKSQINTWIAEGKIKTQGKLIESSSLKALLQEQLLYDLKIKFGDYIYKNPLLSKKNKEIEMLEELEEAEEETSINKKDIQESDGPKASFLAVFSILGTLLYLVYLIFG